MHALLGFPFPIAALGTEEASKGSLMLVPFARLGLRQRVLAVRTFVGEVCGAARRQSLLWAE